MTTFYFGDRWDAPMLDDDAKQVRTPVGQSCTNCSEPIVAGDRGLVRGCVRMVDGKPVGSLEPVHVECDLRSIVGHQFGVCPCNGYGYTRADGMAALAALNQQRAAQGMGPM